MHLRFDGGAKQVYSSGTEEIIENEWNFYTYSLKKQGTLPIVKKYKNGIFMKEETIKNSNYESSLNNWYLGLRWSYQGNGYYYGKIEELSIWETALNQNDIQTVYDVESNINSKLF